MRSAHSISVAMSASLNETPWNLPMVWPNCLRVAAHWVAFEMATQWAATRKQFGQTIGKFQGVSFKLADMATEIECADLITLKAAWKTVRGTALDQDYAM